MKLKELFTVCDKYDCTIIANNKTVCDIHGKCEKPSEDILNAEIVSVRAETYVEVSDYGGTISIPYIEVEIKLEEIV